MVNRRTVLQLAGLAFVQAVTGAAGCGPSAEDRTSSSSSSSPPNPSTPPATQEANAMNQPFCTVKVFNKKGELVGPVVMPKVIKSDEQWKNDLPAKTYAIARAKGTEPAFCGNLLDNHQTGVYTCICCKLPLFSSDSKFNSGTGWPSFFQPVAKENVKEHPDNSYGMERTEILCVRCDCHLGHVFDDGPRPTGLRFCVNSESLAFTPSDKLATIADPIAG
jgi:methionine-R-sulfoxide reductase